MYKKWLCVVVYAYFQHFGDRGRSVTSSRPVWDVKQDQSYKAKKEGWGYASQTQGLGFNLQYWAGREAWGGVDKKKINYFFNYYLKGNGILNLLQHE
jgi:hypothetical protein